MNVDCAKFQKSLIVEQFQGELPQVEGTKNWLKFYTNGSFTSKGRNTVTATA